MPIYEYACGKCGHEFEVEQRITADPIKSCPECRARKVKRLISQTSFVLKGGGWYSDLYSSSDRKDKDKKDGKDGGKDAGEGAAAGASDAKSDKKKTSGDDKGGKSEGKGKSKGKGSKAAA